MASKDRLDAYPRHCAQCGERVKSKTDEPVTHRTDARTGVTESWHNRCRPITVWMLIEAGDGPIMVGHTAEETARFWKGVDRDAAITFGEDAT